MQNCCDFWRSRPWHFLFPLRRVSCSEPAVNQQQQKSSPALAERTRLHLQDVLWADVILSGPASIHMTPLTGSWAPFRGVTAIIRAPAWLPACLHHQWRSLVLLWIPCRRTRHTQYRENELHGSPTLSKISLSLCRWRAERKIWDWW